MTSDWVARTREERLEAFFGEMCERIERDDDVYWCDFFDAAERHGLVVWEPYDPARHPGFSSDTRPGEPVWVKT